MDRRREVVRLLLEGSSPAQIAERLHLPLGSVMNILYNQVGHGVIRRSDILFSIPGSLRHEVEKAIESTGSVKFPVIRRALERAGINASRADMEVYLRLRDARVDLGDMYEFVRDIELRLHEYVRNCLVAEYGDEQWWRKGVPLPVREDCALMSERDHEPAGSLYCYTTLMNLRLIFDREWPVLSRNLPGQLRGDKQELMHSLIRLNRIRNIVMHPVKGIRIDEEDFDFVRQFHRRLQQAEQKVEQELEQKPEQKATETPAETPVAAD